METGIGRADIAIIGAGMAGASLAAEIGDRASVVLIEAESQPGYHSTGRSAAFWSETYGGPGVQALTVASHAYLDEHGFLTPLGAVYLSSPDDGGTIDALLVEHGDAVRLDRLSAAEMAARIPGLRPGHGGGLDEPSCCAIDVAGLHAHYLARARKAGVPIVTDARVGGLTRDGDGWRIATSAGEIEARVVVNAAGAWASEVARLAGAQTIAITPHRRTIVQLAVDPAPPTDLPLIIDAGGRFYLKREGQGRIWLSPHDETPSAPCDTAAEEFDIAVAIDRLERIVDWRVLRRERAWAGLRSFAPDRLPVYGFDAQAPGFFWFAGQGGFGIQTAPAAAMLGAALLLDVDPPQALAQLRAITYAPQRFHSKG